MTLEEKIRKAKNAYLREWRRKNPEKAKAIRERYWEKKVAEMEAQESAEREA